MTVKTLKIRIACMFDKAGDWAIVANSFEKEEDQDICGKAIYWWSEEELLSNKIVWITAEIPMPDPWFDEIEGKVEKEK